MISLFAVVILQLVLCIPAIATKDRSDLLTQCTLDRRVEFDNINATLSWSIISKAAEIEFELIVPISNDQSWAAIGISDTGGMIGTDIGLFTWVNGKEMYDMYSTSFDTPILDTIQDWKLIGASKEDMYSIIRFSRRLDTCDEQDIPFETHYARFWIIVAYNTNDAALNIANKNKLETISYHTEREALEVKLWVDDIIYETTDINVNTDTNSSDETGTQQLYFDINFPNITLNDLNNQNKTTRYYCVSFNQTETNIYTTAMQIINDDYQVVHHMNIYKCSSLTYTTDSDILDELNGECAFDAAIMKDCIVFSALTSNGGKIEVPSSIYYEMHPALYVTQVHYETGKWMNKYSNGEDVIYERSGMRVWYETNKRTYGLLVTGYFGTFSTINIAANSDKSEYIGGFTDSCTNEYFPKIHGTGIMLLALGPHMHKYGQRAKIDIIRMRNGVGYNYKDKQEYEVITIYDKAYDYDRQWLTWFNNVYLFANDTIRIKCIYNTKGETDTISGGPTPTDEMCAFYFLYITLSTDPDEVGKLQNFSRVVADGIMKEGSGNKQELIPTSYCGPFSVSNISYFAALAEKYEFTNERKIGITNEDGNGNMYNEYRSNNRNNFCRGIIYQELNLIEPSSLLNIYSPVVSSNIMFCLIVLFCYCFLLYNKVGICFLDILQHIHRGICLQVVMRLMQKIASKKR